MSAPPPTQTPKMFGGQGLAPAFITASITNFFNPLTPSTGVIMPRAETFSEPPPFGRAVISTLSPSVISQFTCGMNLPVLSPVFFRVKGSTAFGRKGTSFVAL